MRLLFWRRALTPSDGTAVATGILALALVGTVVATGRVRQPSSQILGAPPSAWRTSTSADATVSKGVSADATVGRVGLATIVPVSGAMLTAPVGSPVADGTAEIQVESLAARGSIGRLTARGTARVIATGRLVVVRTGRSRGTGDGLVAVRGVVNVAAVGVGRGRVDGDAAGTPWPPSTWPAPDDEEEALVALGVIHL